MCALSRAHRTTELIRRRRCCARDCQSLWAFSADKVFGESVFADGFALCGTSVGVGCSRGDWLHSFAQAGELPILRSQRSEIFSRLKHPLLQISRNHRHRQKGDARGFVADKTTANKQSVESEAGEETGAVAHHQTLRQSWAALMLTSGHSEES